MEPQTPSSRRRIIPDPGLAWPLTLGTLLWTVVGEATYASTNILALFIPKITMSIQNMMLIF